MKPIRESLFRTRYFWAGVCGVLGGAVWAYVRLSESPGTLAYMLIFAMGLGAATFSLPRKNSISQLLIIQGVGMLIAKEVISVIFIATALVPKFPELPNYLTWSGSTLIIAGVFIAFDNYLRRQEDDLINRQV